MSQFEKYLPIVFGLFNALLSALVSYNKLPIATIAGLEPESIVVAVIAAAIGTILGLQSISNKRLKIALIIIGVLFVLALLGYRYILSQGGATIFEVCIAFLLFFYIFVVMFYILTHLERALAKLFSSGNPPQ